MLLPGTAQPVPVQLSTIRNTSSSCTNRPSTYPDPGSMGTLPIRVRFAARAEVARNAPARASARPTRHGSDEYRKGVLVIVLRAADAATGCSRGYRLRRNAAM